MSKRPKDIPGNSQLSALVFAEEMLKIGESAWRLGFHLEQLSEEGIEIKALRFGWKAGPKGDVLCVVTANGPGGAVVAFHSGATFSEVMRGVITRLEHRSLQWKEDQYG